MYAVPLQSQAVPQHVVIVIKSPSVVGTPDQAFGELWSGSFRNTSIHIMYNYTYIFMGLGVILEYPGK